MIQLIVVGIICFLVGGGVVFLLNKTALKKKSELTLQEADDKAKNMLKEAEIEAEVIKKDKLLEVKEKFLNKKADLEKEVAIRNQKIQRVESKLKQIGRASCRERV